MTLTYPRDIFGDRTGIWDDRPSQNWLGWDIFWSRVAGQRLNMGGSSAFIDHADAIGSTTMETDPSGAVDWDVVNGPWGQAWQQTGTRQSQVFAGMDWQVNDPLIPSATREYSDGLGRWMTPDPGGTKVVSLANPQTWNMYAYVTDNPTTLNDPSGFHGECSAEVANENGGCTAADPNNVQDSTLKDNNKHKSAPPANSEQPPSWTPDKPLPNDPTGLGPDWKPDSTHDPQGKSGDKRYVNDKTGDKLDWHKGQPGERGEKGKDHWHWVPGGEKEKTHYRPGDIVRKVGIPAGAGAAVGWIVHVIIDTAPDWAPVFAIP